MFKKAFYEKKNVYLNKYKTVVKISGIKFTF